MLVKLKNGLTLSLPVEIAQFHPAAYFLLDGRPFDNPNLSVTPARYAVCPTLSDQYEMRQYTIVLGAAGDVVDQAGLQGPLPSSPSEQ